jgi:hypothetical protein
MLDRKFSTLNLIPLTFDPSFIYGDQELFVYFNNVEIDNRKESLWCQCFKILADFVTRIEEIFDNGRHEPTG